MAWNTHSPWTCGALRFFEDNPEIGFFRGAVDLGEADRKRVQVTT
jgi:hypothetical protein